MPKRQEKHLAGFHRPGWREGLAFIALIVGFMLLLLVIVPRSNHRISSGSCSPRALT